MRYLGSKEQYTDQIYTVLKNRKLVNKDLVFFDACCGTASVSDSLKNSFKKIIVNDNLSFASAYASGRLYSGSLTFRKLGFNPVLYFNKSHNKRKGIIYKNYSEYAKRNFFTSENAQRIDYFRQKIEEWKTDKKINMKEYAYLLACLIESISSVINCQGTFGSYLNKWEPRSRKQIIFKCVKARNVNGAAKIESKNKNLTDIVGDVKCDILYLDPPTNKITYSSQYNILESIIRYDIIDNISGKNGSRRFADIDNCWSGKYKACAALAETIHKTQAKHILFTYRNDGVIPREFIEKLMIKYCDNRYYKELNFNKKNGSNSNIFLFYGKKKEENDINFKFPISYTGSKKLTLKKIKPEFSIEGNYMEPFAGTFTVGANLPGFNKYIYNDFNSRISDLIKYMKNCEPSSLLRFLSGVNKKYSLDRSNGRLNFEGLKKCYNKGNKYRKDSAKYLLAVGLCAYNKNLSFDIKGNIINTYGEFRYTVDSQINLLSFIFRLKEMNIEFHNKDYSDTSCYVEPGDTVYIDPPFLVSYNKYWSKKVGLVEWCESQERSLYKYIDNLLNKGVNVYLSNMLFHEDSYNELLDKWLDSHDCKSLDYEIRERKEIFVAL